MIDEAGVGERLHVGDVEVGDPELPFGGAHLEVGLPRLQLVLECRPIDLLRGYLKLKHEHSNSEPKFRTVNSQYVVKTTTFDLDRFSHVSSTHANCARLNKPDRFCERSTKQGKSAIARISLSLILASASFNDVIVGLFDSSVTLGRNITTVI